MVFGRSENQRNKSVLSEINVVPMIDVMLVLLVIFIVTAPLLTHSVKIELPQASSEIIDTPPEKIDLTIRADGSLYWNNMAVDMATLEKHFAKAAQKTPLPEIHIYADKHVEYQFVAKTMSGASQAGLTKIGFVTHPSP